MAGSTSLDPVRFMDVVKWTRIDCGLLLYDRPAGPKMHFSFRPERQWQFTGLVEVLVQDCINAPFTNISHCCSKLKQRKYDARQVVRGT